MNSVTALEWPVARYLLVWAAILSGVTCLKAQEAALTDQLVTYDAPRGTKASEDYAVAASGRPVFVYTIATLHKDDLASFAIFDFAGSVNITIDSAREVKSARVLPASYGITPTVNGNKIQFTLSQPRNLT